ncbi:MAG: hypothetical protein M3P08_15115 [Thermoproteota archaeon]|nr:hypothetical protein [Thermoproteota archaeon]
MNPAEDKKTLLEDSEDEDPSTLPPSGTVCTVSAAIRMHSGDVEVRGGMICGITDKVEKMMIKVFFECGKCGTTNELHSYQRPRFAYEVPAKPSRPLECVNCGEASVHEYDTKVVNALRIELHDTDNVSDLERLSVILFDDDTNNVSTGEQVIVTGSIQKIKKNGRLLPFVFASSIRYHNRKELIMTKRDVQEIKTFVNGNGKGKGNVIELLVSKFAPSVIGYEHVKKGLLLCAVRTQFRRGSGLMRC